MTIAKAVKLQKTSNRVIQRIHSTYKGKSQISEALYLIRPYINVSTYKFLSHFLHTEGTGVTQAKISTICEKVGIAESTYYKIVKPEIEDTFDQPLIITTKAPDKLDKRRTKRVKSSPFKSLLPLSVIKVLVSKKQAEELKEYSPNWEQFEPQSAVENAVNRAVNSAVESNTENPWESKYKGAFSEQQNNYFRKNHLEKPLEIKSNNRLMENDSISSATKKYGIKKEVKEILHKDILADLKDEQRQEFANRIQIALKRTRTDIKDPDIQLTILYSCMDFVLHYEEYPANLKDSEKYYGALYVCIENGILDHLIDEEQEETEEQDFDYELEGGDHEGKHGYDGEYYHQNMRREAYKTNMLLQGAYKKNYDRL